MSPKRKAATPGKPKSLRALARLLGTPESTLRVWRQQPDFPCPEPPYDPREIVEWMVTRERESSDAPELAEARLEIARERSLLLRQRRLTEAGDLHSVSDCERRRLRQIHEVRSALMNLPRSVSRELVGLDIDAIEAALSRRCGEICDAFAAAPDTE